MFTGRSGQKVTSSTNCMFQAMIDREAELNALIAAPPPGTTVDYEAQLHFAHLEL
jgi:hypothetical protein